MAQRKITDLFENTPRTLSFEFYPPKTEAGRDKLLDTTAGKLAELGADYFSVTYGAGGSESKSTLQIVRGLTQRYDVPVMHHLTCIKHTFASVREELAEMKDEGVRNIMALRGDPPGDEPDYIPGPDQPRWGCDLVGIIREYGDWFAVGVPAFPESHPLAADPDVDTKVLRVKQDNGADFAVTQLFFEAELYRRFVDRARAGGVTFRLIPGILPITNYKRLLGFCQMCGATVPDSIRRRFEPIAEDSDQTRAAGIDHAVALANDLLSAGAPGIHFYCLNRAQTVTRIVEQLDI
jgi:methylenetetrahydrofolate reductase (NADPH)